MMTRLYIFVNIVCHYMHVNKQQSCQLHYYKHNRGNCSLVINSKKFKVTYVTGFKSKTYLVISRMWCEQHLAVYLVFPVLVFDCPW